MEGFTGEAAAAIRFDLEVAGFEITTPDKAMLLVSGSSGGNLTGRVTDRSRNTLLSKQYTGASARAQAHAFSDDIVAFLPGRQGIARTKIAFRVETGGVSEIYLADYDGYNAVPVTQDKTINRDVAWVPGQRILYYTSYRLRNPFVYSHNLQSGARQLIAGYPGINAAPAVSPDGRRVAMILSKGGSPDVYVANADGSNLETAHEHQGRRIVALLVAGRAQALFRLAGGRDGAALHGFRGRWGHDAGLPPPGRVAPPSPTGRRTARPLCSPPRWAVSRSARCPRAGGRRPSSCRAKIRPGRRIRRP